jgi:hypothetical protein
MHPTVAAFASPFLPFIRHAKSAPSCKAKTLANAQVFRPSTAEIYPLNSTKIQTLFIGPATFSHWPRLLAGDSGGMKYRQFALSSSSALPQWLFLWPRLADLDQSGWLACGA